MPTVRLDASNVRTLPATRRMNYRDTILRGFMLRVSPTGARSYAITYSRMHRNHTYTLGPIDRLTLAMARDEARRLFACVALGESPCADKRAAMRATLSLIGRLRATDGSLEITGFDLHQAKRPMVYVWSRSDEVLYVGKSMHGLMRVLDPGHHRIAGGHSVQPEDRFRLIPCADNQDACRAEARLIRELQPRLNSRRRRWAMPG